jgi:electron transport complex protein RnfC
VPVCPVNLLPQQLYWYAKSENIEKALAYNLNDCIECGCCNYVCSSNIPLAEYFAFAKALERKLTREEQRIDSSRERFEFKEYRLKRNKQERAEMMALKKKVLKEKMAQDKEKNNAQKDKIAEAMARVKQAKEDKK